MNHRLGPGLAGLGQFINDTTTGVDAGANIQAAGDCCSVEIPLGIERYPFIRFSSIHAAPKAVQHLMNPADARMRQLKNRAGVELTALH